MGAGVEGVVTLECVVTPDGTVGEVRVTQPLEPSLDQAAIDALKQWRFRPGQKDGKAVAVMVEVEMSFTLRDRGPRLDSPEVYKPGPDVTLPKLLTDTKPAYTAAAIRERIEGVVEIECVVRADGTVGHMRVKKPLHPELNRSALKAVSDYRFAPGMKDARAVPVQITLEVSFRLQ
jgi:TonB family protein